MIDDLNFKSTIKLQTTDVFDIESRLAEVTKMREWIEQLVGWDNSQYNIQYKSLGYINVWFKEEKHAIFCSLRWP
jgi:hypothetical protein